LLLFFKKIDDFNYQPINVLHQKNIKYGICNEIWYVLCLPTEKHTFNKKAVLEPDSLLQKKLTKTLI